MKSKKISFDLDLSNKIFKSNLRSLVDISKDNIKNIASQNNYFIQELINKTESNSNDDWFENSSYLANIEWLLLNSIFISAYSFFEHHLFALTSIVENQISTKIKLNDISGKGIIKFSNYLYLVGQIKSADRSKGQWDDISQFQKARNIIVHNGGIMLSDPTKKIESHEIFNFLKKHNVIMAGTIGHIRIREISFLEAFATITSKLSDDLTKEVSQLVTSK